MNSLLNIYCFLVGVLRCCLQEKINKKKGITEHEDEQITISFSMSSLC